ncbi:hypothetical protein [Phycicoccus avicenniae]|uniref:hypothetical protein n=1 Tax=Phycicoccus avicenniae TaxID=2828860 RepID=UPI003D2A101E
MKNEFQRPATELSLPVVAQTKSGDPVRVGVVNGVAATDRDGGGNPSGCATVVTDARSYTYEVAGAIAGPFTPVYLVPRSGATAPILQTTASGAIWGYTVPKVGETGVRTATSGVAVVRPAQV